MTQKTKHIGIVGGGKMGTSVFNFLSQYNFKIVWHIRTNTNEINKKNIRKLNRALKNNLITLEDFNFKIKHQVITNSITDLTDSSLVIECISENLLSKQALIKELFTIINPDAIIASNSSSFKPEVLSTHNNYKTRIVGLHFFFPVEIKHIAELVLSVYNTTENIKKMEVFLTSINKFYLIQNNQNAFILNRIMLKLQAAAFNYITQHNSSFKQIDAAVKQYLFPIGIFEMMDHVGIDIIYQSANNYIKEEKDKSVFLPLINFMKQCIQENKLGIKTQQGFYNYPSTISAPEITDNNKKQIAKYLVNSYLVIYNWAITMGNYKTSDLDFCINEYLDTNTRQWRNLV